jgi:hypothetical protein
VRLAAYTDYVYKQRDGQVYAQRAFALFLARLADEVEGLTITGRLDPEPGESYYRLPDSVEFVPLPHYASLASPLGALPAMARSLGRFWRLLARVEGAWLLGPFAPCGGGASSSACARTGRRTCAAATRRAARCSSWRG